MLVNHVFMYSIGRLLPALINFGAIAAYTRLVKPDDYGLYILGTTTASFLCTTLCLWMRQSVIRFVPQFENERHKIIGMFMTLLLLQLAAIGIIGSVIAFAVFPDDWSYILSVTFLLMAQSWCESTTELLRVDLMPREYSTAYLIRALIAPVIVLALIFLFDVDGQAMVVGMGIAWLVTPLYHIRRYWFREQFGIDREWLKRFAVYGVPMTISAGLQMLCTTSDRWIIAHLMGVAAAGLYAAGADLARQSLAAFMQTINLAALPLALSKMKDGDASAARYQLKQNFNMQMLVIFPALVGMVLVAPNIVQVVLGEAFRATANDVLPVVAVAVFIGGLSTYYFDQAFEFGLSTKFMIPKSMVVAVISVGANFLLIPSLGVIGATYSMLLATTVGLVLSVALGRRYFYMDVDWKALSRIAAAAAFMALVLLPLRSFAGAGWLVVQMSVGGLTYCASALALNAGGCRSLLQELLANRRLGA